MQTRSLGNSNIYVNPIGLGGMSLSIKGRPSESQAIEVIRQGLDAGINFIDTADVYCLDDHDLGHNEKLIAKALKKGDRDKVVIATKGGLSRPNGDWARNADPKHLQQAVEKSLKALDLDYITLYQLHAPDREVPIEKSLEVLARFQQDGKIQHIGLSNVNVRDIQRAEQVIHVVSVQNRCNVNDLSSLKDGVIDYCEKKNIAFIAYSPVGGIFGKSTVAELSLLQKIASDYECTAYQIALAWLLAKSKVIIPIPGATKVSSVVDSAKAMDLELSSETIAQIDQEIGF